MQALLVFVAKLWRHWVSLLGSVLTTVCAFSIFVMLMLDGLGHGFNPYTSAVLLGSMAAGFVVGLLLVPLGLVLGRMEEANNGESVVQTALRSAQFLRRAAFVAIAASVNVLILLVAGEKTVHHMDSPLFCGTACHIPMEPEWVAFQDSPHSTVQCVDCHVGDGLTPTIRAKLDGVKRLKGMVTQGYRRPVPSPVHEMRAAAETCGKCHEPDRRPETKLAVFPRFKDDKENTAAYNVALLYMGGRNPKTGQLEGIHSHGNPGREIQYEMLDEAGTRVGAITVLQDGKQVARYQRPDETGTPVATRTMDCMDCHNRPSHQFDLDADVAADRALAQGLLDRAVPYAKNAAVTLLNQETPSRADAPTHFTKAVRDLYAASWPEEKVSAEDLDKLGAGIAALYLRNIFPEMKVTWRTYPMQVNHRDDKDQVGCFRCHNDDYEATMLEAGREGKLDQDCERCHAMLATEEDPADFEDTMQMLVPAAAGAASEDAEGDDAEADDAADEEKPEADE